MKKDTLDLICAAMFDTEAQMSLSPQEMGLLMRMQDGYTYWLENPFLSDIEVRDYLIHKFGISKVQAYHDLNNIKVVLGNVRNAAKEFYRYKINSLLDEAANAARYGKNAQAKALAKVAEIMAMNNRTDKDDGEKIPFDSIIIKDWSFSINPEDAGVTRKPGAIEAAKRLKKKLLADEGIQDSDFEDMTLNGEGEEIS